MLSNTDVVRALLQAYTDKDRTAIEALVADKFRFTSPNDNGIDRETYFEKCWPNCERIVAIEIKRTVDDGDHVFVVSEIRMKKGKGMRNCELHTVHDSKVTEIEVYFGWTVPHEASPGGHVEETDEKIGAA